MNFWEGGELAHFWLGFWVGVMAGAVIAEAWFFFCLAYL
jgi:hypothetical protein